ncbi:GGDEF domain-containing protein [Salinimonas marina]|uniref:diguanylate cyclase n=1 Tax=Salinimonas marina TaxID=2785918 RepID=A0A7S9DV72_9ALTE|nr:GGDEF domain-containing protein [Salinimonas marina]QPG04508.1 GGDEF domain-containing protein [Salinimonas marina]
MFKKGIFYTLLCLLAISSGSAPAQSDSVIYCARENWLPYEGVRNSHHIGLIPEYLRLVSELTGLEFKPLKTVNRQQSLRNLDTNQCQVAVLNQNFGVNDPSIQFSSRFMDIPDVLVTRSGMPMLQGYAGVGERRLAVVEDYQHRDYLNRYYPAIQVIPLASETEGFRALRRGDVDVLVGSLLSVNAHLNKPDGDDFIISGIAQPYDGLHFAVSADAAPWLLPRLEQGIGKVPESRSVALFKQYNPVKVRQRQQLWPMIFIAAVALMFIVIIVWRQRVLSEFRQTLRNQSAELASQQVVILEKSRTIEFLTNHDTVTGLYNRNHFILKGEEEISRFTRFHSPAALVVMELIGVKPVTGEAKKQSDAFFLRIIGKACIASVREVDVVARWSNDQLIFLCPQTGQDDAMTLAHRLLYSIENAAVEAGFEVNIAAGVAGLQTSWSFNDWYEQACSILYQARRQGGGVVSLDYF